MQKLDLTVGVVGVAALVAAAGCWLYASLIDVPNNIDTIVGGLQRVSQWNAYAAASAGVAAICAAYAFARENRWL